MSEQCLRVDDHRDPSHEIASTRARAKNHDMQLSALAALASVDIETSLIHDLSGSLHNLFDDVCDKALPIYFGPLLGRLYLEGL